MYDKITIVYSAYSHANGSVTFSDKINNIEMEYDETITVDPAEITCEVDTSELGETTATFTYTWKPGSVYEKTLTCQKTVVVEEEQAAVYRITGTDCYETSLKTADEYREVLGVDRFDAVILTCGDKFADALAGSYLSAKKDAPILMIDAASASKVTIFESILCA